MQVRIKVNDADILNIVSSLDGTKTVDELAQVFNVNIDSLKALPAFMEKNCLFDVSEPKNSFVEKLILMDGDIIDVTNLHRQYGFCSADIGKKKVDILGRRLQFAFIFDRADGFAGQKCLRQML